MQFQFLDLCSPLDDLPGYLCREVGCAAGWHVDLVQSQETSVLQASFGWIVSICEAAHTANL